MILSMFSLKIKVDIDNIHFTQAISKSKQGNFVILRGEKQNSPVTSVSFFAKPCICGRKTS